MKTTTEVIAEQAPRLLEWLTGIAAEKWRCEKTEYGLDFTAAGGEASVGVEDDGQCSLHTERLRDGNTCDFNGSWETIHDEVFLLP